jgi:hypothetical protein
MTEHNKSFLTKLLITFLRPQYLFLFSIAGHSLACRSCGREVMALLSLHAGRTIDWETIFVPLLDVVVYERSLLSAYFGKSEFFKSKSRSSVPKHLKNKTKLLNSSTYGNYCERTLFWSLGKEEEPLQTPVSLVFLPANT